MTGTVRHLQRLLKRQTALPWKRSPGLAKQDHLSRLVGRRIKPEQCLAGNGFSCQTNTSPAYNPHTTVGDGGSVQQRLSAAGQSQRLANAAVAADKLYSLDSMHTSLTTRANIVLILLWVGILIGMLAMNWPQPLAPIGLAFVLGIAAGLLQTHAMSDMRRSANTAKEVRRVLVSTRSGKLAVVLLWGTAVGMLVWALLLVPKCPLVLWIPAYTSFAFARELAALPAVMRLGVLT